MFRIYSRMNHFHEVVHCKHIVFSTVAIPFVLRDFLIVVLQFFLFFVIRNFSTDIAWTRQITTIIHHYCRKIIETDIPKTKRITEEELLAEFEECKAEILGGILDTLVKAIRLYPLVKPKGLFRMADFTRWGCAIAMALGHTQQDFIDAYETKVRLQIEEAALASPVATVLVDLIESIKKWDGTPSQLYIALNNHAKILNISTHQKTWPKAPHVLVRQLNELAPSLKMLGWAVETGIRSSATRKVCINSVTSVTSVTGTTEKPEKEPVPEKGEEKEILENDASVTPANNSVIKASPSNNVKSPSNDGNDANDAILNTFSEPIIVAVKSWCLAHRNEHSEISLADLARFIKNELKQDPQRVITEAFDKSILVEHPKKPGLAVVI